MFVDGREIETRVFNEGIGLPDAKSDKPVPTVFRIGWDKPPRVNVTVGAWTKSQYGPGR